MKKTIKNLEFSKIEHKVRISLNINHLYIVIIYTIEVS